ncbi:hypothetical protein DM02DRAFT_705107 [Periconia macrospinosa]|uniref:Uncharacterized protein n=1 Tax=Periconia macrospinosa TaxID=97972 RepID=A0A2V1DU35_9PLEO|nr:hypothetical protein DM02DRAFT_705107 [Periconia macrospinosa]
MIPSEDAQKELMEGRRRPRDEAERAWLLESIRTSSRPQIERIAATRQSTTKPSVSHTEPPQNQRRTQVEAPRPAPPPKRLRTEAQAPYPVQHLKQEPDSPTASHNARSRQDQHLQPPSALQTPSPQEYQTEVAFLRTSYQHLQEEMASIKSSCEDLRREVAFLRGLSQQPRDVQIALRFQPGHENTNDTGSARSNDSRQD